MVNSTTDFCTNLRALRKAGLELDVVAHIFKPRSQEAEMDIYLCIQGQPSLYSKFKISQGYTLRPSLKKKKKQKKRKRRNYD